jgi:molybdate transport system substrate-binding protein
MNITLFAMTFRRLLPALFSLLLCLAPAAAMARDINIFAAASLKTALDEIGKGWSGPDGSKPVFVYAGSSAIAKQIMAGAPADIFFSADLDWMDHLESRGLIDPSSRHNLLGNTLVLIAPVDLPSERGLPQPAELVRLLAGGRLAIANVDAVPAGRYAKAALQSLGLWDAVSNKLAQSENVRAALAFVARGEAPLGIVYGSDAIAEPKVKVLATFPASSHPPIIYPAALVAERRDRCGQAFLDYLGSPSAAAIFARNGFTPLTVEPP